MFNLEIQHASDSSPRSWRVRSRKALRAAMRSYIAEVGRRKARNARVRIVLPDGTKKSFFMRISDAYKAQPRAAA